MRHRLAVLLLAGVAAGSFTSSPANASSSCGYVGPVQLVGPVCLVKCAAGAVDPSDVKGTVQALTNLVCPA